MKFFSCQTELKIFFGAGKEALKVSMLSSVKVRLIPYHKNNGESGLSSDEEMWFGLKEKSI